MRGRKPKATVVKLATGNPGGRPLNKNEPKPGPGELAPPSWLDETAKKFWRSIVPAMRRLGMYSELDQGAMAAYCAALADLRAARLALRKQGKIVSVVNGNGKETKTINPHFRLASEAVRQISKLGSDLGLSPAARCRLNVIPIDEPDGESIEDDDLI